MSIKIALFHSGAGDWEGLYIDGKLVDEGHSLDLVNVIQKLSEKLGFEFEDVDSNDEYLDRYGNRCPSSWSEIDE